MERVTVCIPTIPPRHDLLLRAVKSVMGQTHPAAAVSIAMDLYGAGAWRTRNRAMDAVHTQWIAFLDDDDELLPSHLERCLQTARETGADVVVPWYDVVGGQDPVPGHRVLPVDPYRMHSFGITCLLKAEVANQAAFRPREETGLPEDFHFWIQLGALGAKFAKLPETTWLWHHHGLNTSGLPTWT